MKPSDLFLKSSKTTMAMAGLLIFCSDLAYADAPSPETFNKPAELVLTLSDRWLTTDNPGVSPSLKTSNRSNANKIIINKKKNIPLNMDCGMDVNPYAGNDNSLTGRLTGECDLRYNY